MRKLNKNKSIKCVMKFSSGIQCKYDWKVLPVFPEKILKVIQEIFPQMENRQFSMIQNIYLNHTHQRNSPNELLIKILELDLYNHVNIRNKNIL